MNNKTVQDILIIGDKSEAITTTIKILENFGHNVEGRTSLNRIKEYIEEKPPTLIYLIVFEKNKLFYSLLDKFQQDSSLVKIPIIVIGIDNSKVEEKYRTFNICNYLHLPINSTALSSANHLFLKSKRSLSYLFNDTRRLRAKFKGDLIRINEISALIQSPVKFSSDQELELNSSYLKNKLQFDIFLSKIFDESKYSQSKTYLTELIILGLKEENTKQIRAILKV